MVVAPVAARLLAALAAANAAAVWIAFTAGGAILGPVTQLLMPGYVAAGLFAVTLPSLIAGFVRSPVPRVAFGGAAIALAGTFLVARILAGDAPATLYGATLIAAGVVALGAAHVLRVFGRHNALLARPARDSASPYSCSGPRRSSTRSHAWNRSPA